MPGESGSNVATTPLGMVSAQDTQPNGDSTALFEQLVLEAARQIDSAVEDAEDEAALARLLALPVPTPAPMATIPSGNDSRRQIGQYELLDRIAGGGMGEVFRARHRLLDEVVAIKLIRPDHQLNSEAIERFKQEIRTLGQLKHPQIVAARDANEHDGLPYLVMEYIEGRPLSNVVETAQSSGIPLSIAEACDYVRQAALGLQAAHDLGVVHRDVKPSNLIVDGSGVVKILDLGLAKATEALGVKERPEAATELTREGQVMGTPDYMAPEQLRDSRQVDARTDVYALGATLFKLLTGRAPFADDAHRTPESKIMAIGSELPPEVTTLRADVPAELGTLVGRMLAKDRGARPATANEVARQLERFCGSPEASGAIVTPATTTRVSLRTPRSWRRRALALLAGLGLLAIVLVLRTPHGEVLVELADGVGDDIRIEIDANGRVLIADKANGWLIEVPVGEHPVKVTGGSDCITLEKHSVLVERNKQARVKVTLSPMPNDVVNVAKPVAVKKPKVDKPVTTPVDLPSVIEKPFAVLREGKPMRDFKTWAGVLGVLEAGDTIEVQGQGPYALPNPPFNHLDVTVRAAAGSRPELHFVGMNTHHASLKLDGIDLVGRHDGHHPGELRVFGGAPGLNVRWEIANCRVAAYGIQPSPGSTLKVTDSLMLVHGIHVPDDGEADFENNVIFASHSSGCFKFPGGGSRLRLNHNTIISTRDFGSVALLHFGHPDDPLPKVPVRVEARHNLFAFDGGIWGQHIFPGLAPEKNAAAVDWQGEGNLYCPSPQAGLTTKNGDDNEVAEHPLDAWARKLNRKEREPNSQIAHWPHWKLAEAWWSKDEEYFATLRKQIEAEIPAERRHEVGPQWELIGPGEAYVRALAAAGTPVAEKDLFPEALPGGPCVLLRDGQEVRGYRTLHDACSAAMPDDIIELRTNRNVGDAIHGRGNLLLTIRAGAGYSPEVGTLQVIQGCRAILEGLRFAPGAILIGHAQEPNQALGQYVRIANCSFRSKNSFPEKQAGNLSIMYGGGEHKRPLEILNCWFDGTLLLASRPDQPIRLDNCVVPKVDLAWVQQEVKDASHRIEFNRCAVWSPEPRHGRGCLTWAHADGIRHIEIVAHGTLFETPFWIRQYDVPLRWQGTKNLFRVGHPDWFHTTDPPGPGQVISGLDDLRKTLQSDADSMEAHPLAWEPEQWKLLPTSPGYQAGPEGQDIGADVSRIARTPKPAEPQTNDRPVSKGRIIVDEDFEDGRIDGIQNLPASDPSSQIVTGESTGQGQRCYAITATTDEFERTLQNRIGDVRSVELSFAVKFPDGFPVKQNKLRYGGLLLSSLGFHHGNGASANTAIVYYAPDFETPGQPERWALESHFGPHQGELFHPCNLDVKPDRWLRLRSFAKRNTPGQRDGIYHLWVDDTSRINERSIAWSADAEQQIDHLWVGGSLSLHGERPDIPFRWLIDDIRITVDGTEPADIDQADGNDDHS